MSIKSRKRSHYDNDYIHTVIGHNLIIDPVSRLSTQVARPNRELEPLRLLLRTQSYKENSDYAWQALNTPKPKKVYSGVFFGGSGGECGT